jgi:hypothetical protein
MNWADLLDWILRILGGLAALVGLALFVALLGNLGKVFAWLGNVAWRLINWLSRLVRSPRQALLEAVDHSALFAFALFPFIWLLEKLWLQPRLKRLARRRNPEQPADWPNLPPWNEAPVPTIPATTSPPVPAPLVELVRLWETGFDIQPLFNLPSCETFILSYYVYPQLWEADVPSILVEATKPRGDLPRWRLALPSGKDVLCVEIDEAEFLAWWRQTLFNEKGEMDLAGWQRASELAIGWCDAHGYPNWRYAPDPPSPEDQQRWREGLIAELAAYHDAVLYARTWDWGAPRVALWREEIVARYGPLHAPERDWKTNELRPVQSGWAGDFALWLEKSQPIRLIDLLQAENGTEGLVHRMHRKSMPPYSREELVQAAPPRWVLAEDSSDSVCLLLESIPDGQGGETTKVHFPKAWTESPDWPNKGPFNSFRDRYIVASEFGLSGVIDPEGRFTVPCQYAYLYENSGSRGKCFEAATSLAADIRGEILCDLIDGDGRRIHPPGLKVLAGTLARDGCVVTTEDENKPLRLDWMDATGVVRNGEAILGPDELRWAAVGNMSNGRRLVRCPDSGLWGFLQKTGAVAIPPAFSHASWFDNGLAKVGNEPGKVGLIEPDGAWRIQPVWTDIWPESKQCYVVKNELAEFGAINPAGEVIVPFKTEAELTQDSPQNKKQDPRFGLGEDFDPIELVMRQWRQSTLRKHVDAAKTQDSLASLEGVFDSNARTRDLIEAGVWFRTVRVLRVKSDGLLQPKAGESGRIYAEYPVSLSIFDLSVEAPVSGLASAPQAIVGVPWRDLAINEAKHNLAGPTTG